MDPNELYERLMDDVRTCIEDVERFGGSAQWSPDVHHMAVLIDNLDKWIRGGGFLPQAWSRMGEES